LEKQDLKAHAEALQRQIDEVNKRLDELSDR
jgi:prefoldin subunit 5